MAGSRVACAARRAWLAGWHWQLLPQTGYFPGSGSGAGLRSSRGRPLYFRSPKMHAGVSPRAVHCRHTSCSHSLDHLPTCARLRPGS